MVQRLDVPLAWVYVGSQRTGSSMCSGVFPPPTAVPHPIAHPSHAWVVIIDARDGTAYTYVGAGAGTCQPAVQPILRPAVLRYSIPFTVTQIGAARVRLTLSMPPCGSLDSLLFAGPFSMAMASVPSGACHKTATTQVRTIEGRISESPHAPLGLICEGTYDPVLGLPRDCLPRDAGPSQSPSSARHDPLPSS